MSNLVEFPRGPFQENLATTIKSDQSPTQEALEKPGGGGQNPPMDETWKKSVDDRLTGVDNRLTGLEKEVHGIKGSLDWMKVAFSLLIAVVGLVAGGMWILYGKVDAISSKLSDEFRAQRAEMSAQTSAIANAITATRQQAPQVILMPAPAQDAPRK